MPSTKLTKAMRELLANKILDTVRLPRDLALREQEQSLAIRMLRHRYGNDVFDRCRALPERWLPLRKQLAIDSDVCENIPRSEDQTSYNGRYRYLGAINSISLVEYAPLPNDAHSGWNRATLGPLYDDVYAYAQARADLHEELTNLKTQTLAVLNSFTTIEKLAEGWPEGYAHFPQETLAQTGGLPAPRISDLNERIEALRKKAA